MSKPISFGFGKQKPPAATKSTSTSTTTTTSAGGALRKPTSSQHAPSRPRPALRHDSDNEDEEEPRHESVTGFASDGAILSHPVKDKRERVINNAGNLDWRKRGMPSEVQTQQQGGDMVMVERDEVSTASGLQFATQPSNGVKAPSARPLGRASPHPDSGAPTQPLTADEEALQALLDDGSGRPNSNAVIEQQGNIRLSARDEIEDFRDDVAARPESSTLEEYAAMPVEEFGLAMLRGMGQKRRANGEVINLSAKANDSPRKVRKQEGFLGIGAKAAPGTDVELGAWGKADMRKNNKGEGFFTPLMRENRATGERITEDELQARLRIAKGAKAEEDWRARRDRNLESSGRDRDRDRDRDRTAPTKGPETHRDQMNAFSRSSSSRREREDRDDSRSKKDRQDREHDSSRSRRDQDSSRDRKRRDDDYDDRRHRDKHRGDHHRDDEKYDSSTSHRSHRDRERDKERERDKDDRNGASDRRHRDRHGN